MAGVVSALRQLVLAAALVAAGSKTALAALVYATSMTGHTINVIDTATNTIVAQPDVGGISYIGAGVLPNGNYAYIAVANPNQVAVLDTLTHSVVATVDTLSQAWGFAALPDSSRVYVSDYSANRILVVDAATNTVAATITGVVQPYGAVAAPDGSKVYVATFSGTSVVIIDTATNTIADTIDLGGSSAVAVDISPDGGKLYVVLPGAPAVAVYDTTTLARTATYTLPSSARGIALSADGAKAYVALNSSANVVVFDTATGSQITSITVGTAPRGVSLDATRSRLYVTNSGSGSVSVIDVTTDTVIDTITPTPGVNSTGRFLTPELSTLTIATSTAGGSIRAGLATGPQLTCTATCRRNFNVSATVTLTAVPLDGYAFDRWGGDCSGTAISTTIDMATAPSCSASFTQLPPPPPTPPPPPPPVPGWFNENALAPQLATTVGLDGQFVSASLAPFFQDPASLTFSVSRADGGALPAGITFDPATLTFGGTVQLADRPVQTLPTADPTGRSVPNPVYPASALIERLPVLVTARDGRGASYGITQYLDLQTPREPVAMAALSVSRDGRSGGNAMSSKPALSHDGGQIVFQSAATNLVTRASPAGTDILRYHTLAGTLDRLSQSAFPGGGPSSGALGPAVDPAVSNDGQYAAFTASGQGLVVGLDTGGKRQVYRIGLKHPRIDLDPATPTAELVSGTAEGVAGNDHSGSPALSADGRYVAFVSRATNLGIGQDGTPRIWRKDMSTGALTPVSAPEAGAAADPAITADGQVVAFASGGQVHLRDLGTGALRTIAPGASPRLSANGDTIVFVAENAVIAVRGTNRDIVGAGDQPSVSDDGRFVAWRTPEGQIQVGDILRGVSALVSRTGNGSPGNGNSANPAIAGDGRSIAFATNARDLVGGTLAAGQIMLAGNPLVDPAGTRYWYVASGDRQPFAVERRGDRAYVASLTYDAAGASTWTAGFCSFAGLTCTGSGFAIVFAETGTEATLRFGQTSLELRAYPLGGNTRPAMPGLPEGGWWYNLDDPGSATGWFLAIATPDANGIPGAPVALLTGAVYDATGRPFWLAGQGTIGDGGLAATLNRYAGGAPLGQASAQPPSASPAGPIALTWSGPRNATAILPNGQRARLGRWPF